MGGGELSTTVINLGYGEQREPRLDKYAKVKRKEYPPKGKERVVDIYTSETGLGTSSVSTTLTRGLPVKGTHRVISFEATKIYGEGYGERRPSNKIGADEVVVSIGDATENLSYPGGKKMKKLTSTGLKEHETVEVKYERKNPYNSIFKSTRKDTSGKQIDVEYLGDMRLNGAILTAGYTSSGEPMEIKTSTESYQFGRDDFSVFGDLHVPISEQDTSRMPVPTVAGLIGK